MPVDLWKKEADRIKYGHRAPQEPRKHKMTHRGFDTVLWFGKHKGQSIRQVKASDPDYIQWLMDLTPDSKRLRNLLKFLWKMT